MSLLNDNIPGGGYCTRRSDIWSPTPSPTVSRVRRGTRVCPVVGSFPGRMSPRRYRCCVGVAAGCWTHGFQFVCVEPVCDIITPNVDRSDAVGFSVGDFSLQARSTTRHQCLGCIALPPRWRPWVCGIHQLARELSF